MNGIELMISMWCCCFYFKWILESMEKLKLVYSVLYDEKKSIDFYWAADDPMCVVESTENTI